MEKENEFELREPIVVYGKRKFTVKEYLEMEHAAIQKHEFYRGEIFAMAGASLPHNDIYGNMIFELKKQLKGKKCRPFGSDMRMHIPQTTLYTYPDISVYCDPFPVPVSNTDDTAMNPAVIVEILSESTRKYDQEGKLLQYQCIPTLKEYIMVDSQKIGVEIFSRDEHYEWTSKYYDNLEGILYIPAIQVEIPLSGIYEHVDFNKLALQYRFIENEFELREPLVAYGKKKFTEEEYLAMEREAIIKHEYYQGEIFAMSNVSLPHNLISFNLIDKLMPLLRNRSCIPANSDMRMYVEKNGLFTYPDLAIYCPPNFKMRDDHNDTAVNPTIIIEILSKSTRRYDREDKFALYQQIPTLKEYILVDSQKIGVELFRANDSGEWKSESYNNMNDVLEVYTLQAKILLADIYEKVDFNRLTL